MNPKTSLALRIIIFSAIYFLLNNPGTMAQWKTFQIILYPIRSFTTFLHELGHALGALITKGSVLSVEIHKGGGGLTWTRGGYRPVVIMGGYLGSALFGNILFYIGARKPNWVKPTLGIIIFAMLVTGFIWYKTPFTTFFLCLFSAALFVIGFKTKFGRDILMFLGLASVLYIIQNFQVGPSSDLRSFEAEMGFLPAKLWMYIWLAIAITLLAINLKMLFSIKDIEEIQKPDTRKRQRINTAPRFNRPNKK